MPAPPGRQELEISQGKQAASAVANLKPEGLRNMGRVLAHWINHELASKSGLKCEPGVKSRPGRVARQQRQTCNQSLCYCQLLLLSDLDLCFIGWTCIKPYQFDVAIEMPRLCNSDQAKECVN